MPTLTVGLGPYPLVFACIFSFPNPNDSQCQMGCYFCTDFWILFFLFFLFHLFSFPKGLRALDSSWVFSASSIFLNSLVLSFVGLHPQSQEKRANLPVRPGSAVSNSLFSLCFLPLERQRRVEPSTGLQWGAVAWVGDTPGSTWAGPGSFALSQFLDLEILKTY